MANRPLETLIIDDNIDDVDLIKFALRQQSIPKNISVAFDGLSALDFLHKRGEFKNAPTPDLVLLDLVLPKLSGIEVLEHIKTDEKLKIIPVVVFATSDANKDIFKTYDLHANAYISKPIDFEKFSFQLKKLEDFWFNTATLPPKD